MEMNTDIKIDNNKYDSEELDRPTTASSFKPTTVIKYMAPRTLGLNLSNSFQGSLRNFALSNVRSNFIPSSITTSYGLASFSTIPSSHNIDDEQAIDEHNELSKLNETLTENILYCCHLDVNNRAKELQLEWFETNTNKNSLIIEKMFRTEIQTARQLIEDALNYKLDLEKKLNDIHQTTLANDKHYQQLLSKRNSINKDIFDYQRQLAQNRAESEFLHCRIQYFNDEIQFYTLKNKSLQTRQVKLRYEFDEEIFAKQVLQMELEVLENEKITNEDTHLTSIDDIRGTINSNQITTIQPSNYFREQLNYQLRSIRSEYEKKIQTYADELHRKFELESYRYKMYKTHSTPTVTREHEQKLEEYKREKKDIEKEISSIRGSINQLQNRIEILEKQIEENKINNELISNSQRHLTMLEQIIDEKEKQLDEVIRIRTELKQQIENYREEINQYSKLTTEDSYEIEESSESLPQNLIIQSPSSEVNFENNQKEQSSPNISQPVSPSIHSEQASITETNETPLEEEEEEETLAGFTDFDAEQDCEELNKIVNEPNIDEVAVINILCNRSVAQRLQIRDTYKNLYGQHLNNIIETEITGNSKKLLKILLLSPIERDCNELRRVLKGINIDENIFIEIFLSRTNTQIKTIIDNYSKLFKNTLEQDIINGRDTSSKRIFLALLQADRPDDDDIDNDEVLNDARNLNETNSKWRTDGSTFIELLCNRSNTHLKQIFDVYQQFSGIDIEQSIKIDTDADLSRTLMAIIRIVRNAPRFFAYELRKSLKAFGTNEDNLTRIIVSRCEIDIEQIISEYEKISKRTLYDQIQMNTNGDYKRALLELLDQYIEPFNNELSFEQVPESPELPKKNRPTVQWKESVNKQSFEHSMNNQDINDMKQFDRNNQALTINTRPYKSQYIEQYSYSNENEDE